MPDPNSNQPINQSTNQPATPAAPSVFPQPDLPPLPPAFQSVVSGSSTPPPVKPAEETIHTPINKPIETSGSATPVSEFPPMISSTPKKKFGGGRVIATILGLFLLVGGVGAGIVLTQQPQLLSSLAVKINPNDIGNPSARIAAGGGNGGSGGNNPDIVNQQAGSYNASLSNSSITYNKVDYGVTGSTGKTCSDIGDPSTRQQCFLDHPVGNADATKPCGTTDNPLGSVSSDGQTCVVGGIGCNGTDNNCANDHWTTCADKGGTGNASCLKVVSTANGGGTSTTTTTSGPSAICLNVTAYSASWVALTDADLSALQPDTTVNFCVVGSVSSGAFDKAQFKINTTLEPETTAIRPGSTNEYCQSYKILSTDTTVNVRAKIHEATLGWEGASI